MPWSMLACALFTLGCAEEKAFPHRPITLVCPWAAGGGTDRVSRQVAAHLEEELGVPVNVINATGGKGVTGHSRGLRARPDGYTIAMITLELNMMHWSGLTSLTPDDCIPLMSLNEDYCALLVGYDAPWRTLAELRDDIARRPGQLKASGTSTGGAWHLALAGWLIAEGRHARDVIWVSSTGAGPSLQELVSGGLDMVACSLPEAETLMDAKQVRALGVMAPKRAKGYEGVPTFAEQGSDWSLGGWRGLAVPLGTHPGVVQRLETAITRVVRGETRVGEMSFPEFMDAQGFDSTSRPAAEFAEFMRDNDRKFGQLLTSDEMRSVNSDPFNPMSFPYLVLACLGLCLAGLAVTHFMTGRADPIEPAETKPSISARGIVNAAAILAAVVAYQLLVEPVGFVLVAGGMLFLLQACFGVPLRWNLPLTLIVVPSAYQLFEGILRVPLPRGWFGW
jgi:tripartite-type tricarboxylate transporter receptor subunit TctC